MRLRSLTGAAAIIVAASTALIAGQEGALRVTVLKPDRTPLAGVTIRATVSVSSPGQINSAIVTKTDAQGIANFWKLTPGVFTIQVDVEGFDAGAIRTDVQADKISHLQVLLRPLPAIEIGIETTFDTLDPTSATTGINVKPEMIQAIPTGVTARLADSALLAPGVNLDPVLFGNGSQRASQGDPSLLVTMNRDKSGRALYSTNNYLLDGIDVSEPLYGRGTVNIMQDLIADVDIKTGGVSAEYQAKNGIFVNATTINGSNEWHGGFTADFSPESLQANPKPGRPSVSSTYQSTGFYVSGPLIKDKLWMVAAAQGVLDHGTLVVPAEAAATPGETRAFRANDEKNLFGKLTWQASPSNRFIGEFHSNRRTSDNADSGQSVTNWTYKAELGGDRYLLWYSFQQPWLIADVKYGRDYQVQNVSALHPGDYQIKVFSFDPLTAGQSELGTRASSQSGYTSRTNVRADFLVPFNSGPIRHTLKFGYETARTEYNDDFRLRAPFFEDVDSPMTFGDLFTNNFTLAPYFIDPLLYQLNNNPAYSSIKTALHGPDGTVGFDELMGYRFDERNSLNQNTFLVTKAASLLASNPSSTRSKMNGYYIQDYMTVGNFTFSPGFRRDHYSATNDIGITAFQQKSLVAPRVSLTWDVFGNAKAKAYAYFGRYFNPPFGSVIQTLGLTKTTGTAMQVRMLGQWVDVWASEPNDPSYATVFADSTEMPYTDETRFGYEHLIRSANTAHTLLFAATYRKDKKIIQNIDAYSYTDPDALESATRYYFGITNPTESLTANEARVINAVRSLALPVSAFNGGGRSGEDNMALNVPVFMNAPGAERTFRSFDLSYKAESDRGLFFVTFSTVKAEGNSMETGAQSASSYYPFMDARLPWMHGRLDGSIDWLFKVYGSYKFKNNLTIGLFARLDSGYHYTPSFDSSNSLVYQVPNDVDQLDGFKPGQKMSPKRANLDLHLEKRFQLSKQTHLIMAVNIYNLVNNQNGIALAEGTNVRAGVAVDQPYLFNPPRTVSVSARFRF